MFFCIGRERRGERGKERECEGARVRGRERERESGRQRGRREKRVRRERGEAEERGRREGQRRGGCGERARAERGRGEKDLFPIYIYIHINNRKSINSHKKSILQSWYIHSSISHAHGINQKLKICPGDGHTAELAKFH